MARQRLALCRALCHLQRSPPAAPSTVFLGLMSDRGVLPTVLPTTNAPTSAAMTQATARKVAKSPTVHCPNPPSRTCAVGLKFKWCQ